MMITSLFFGNCRSAFLDVYSISKAEGKKTDFESENELNEKHIEECARNNAEECTALPNVCSCNGQYRDKLRQKSGKLCEAYVLQAIHNEHSHDCVGKKSAELRNEFRRFAVTSKDQKR